MASPTSIDLHAPAEHPCYEGHFPGNPIVPGALLLQWISELASEAFKLRISGVKQMKFLAPVRPNDRCVIEFNLQKAGSDCNDAVIKICCLRDSAVVCKGTLLVSHTFMSTS